MLTNILKYQSLEQKLLVLQKKLDEHPDKKVLNNMVSQVKSEQNKLISLEDQAQATLKEFETLKAEYEKALAKMNDIIKTPTENLEEKELDALIKKAGELSNVLNNLERKVSTSGMKVSQILQQFENAKKNIILTRTKHKQAKEKFDLSKQEIEPQIASIQKQMKDLEPTIEANILSKYKHIRQDNIFPVFVPLQDNSCGGCRMGMSAAFVNKVKDKGCLECEQCRRLVYIK